MKSHHRWKNIILTHQYLENPQWGVTVPPTDQTPMENPGIESKNDSDNANILGCYKAEKRKNRK